MDAYVAANRAAWDAWTPYHVRSQFYDVEGFKAGRHELHPTTLAGPGDVAGKSLLHLQCHFGLDTLAWARRGAVVTGVDFSAEAITAARGLAAELQLPATFVHSDVYDLPRHLGERFDVVFTSHGALCWLPDLDGWARVVAAFLKPGGVFSVIEGHPFALIFDERRSDTELRLREPYFSGPEPLREEQQGSYAAPDAPFRSVSYVWLHPLAEIIGSLLRAGLHIAAFEEYSFLPWPFFPWMEQRSDGMWQLPGGRRDIPLMFSLRAVRPGNSPTPA